MISDFIWVKGHQYMFFPMDRQLEAEGVRIVGGIRAFEAGGRVVVVFRLDEYGEGFVAVE